MVKAGMVPKLAPEIKAVNIKCAGCQTLKSERYYYIDELSKTKRQKYCKKCVSEKITDANGEFDKNKFIDLLSEYNKPFLFTIFKNVLKEGKPDGIAGKYFNIMNQDKYLDKFFENSVYEDEEIAVKKEEILKEKPFVVTKEMETFWGEGYDSIDYKMFQAKYNELSVSYVESTAFHTERLKEYIRFQCKAERAIANKNPAEAETWIKLAQKSAIAAKINPNQMSQADLSGGLNSFGELFKEIEKAKEMIEILPEYKYKPKDAVDFTIWCYVNYVRDLKGLPQETYEEVYSFYDKAKAKFIEKFGDDFFKDDPTEKNRERVKNWITYRNNDDNIKEEEVVL